MWGYHRVEWMNEWLIKKTTTLKCIWISWNQPHLRYSTSPIFAFCCQQHDSTVFVATENLRSSLIIIRQRGYTLRNPHSAMQSNQMDKNTLLSFKGFYIVKSNCTISWSRGSTASGACRRPPSGCCGSGSRLPRWRTPASGPCLHRTTTAWSLESRGRGGSGGQGSSFIRDLNGDADGEARSLASGATHRLPLRSQSICSWSALWGCWGSWDGSQSSHPWHKTVAYLGGEKKNNHNLILDKKKKKGVQMCEKPVLPSFPFRTFPLLLICLAASSVRYPDTTDTLTPAFSKTFPSCITQLIPPPPEQGYMMNTVSRRWRWDFWRVANLCFS